MGMMPSSSSNLSFDSTTSSTRESMVSLSLSSLHSRTNHNNTSNHGGGSNNHGSNNSSSRRFLFGMFLFFMVVFQVSWSFKEERKLLGGGGVGGGAGDLALIQLPAGVGGGGEEDDDQEGEGEGEDADATKASKLVRTLRETQKERDEARKTTIHIQQQLDTMAVALSGLDNNVKQALSQLEHVEKERDEAKLEIQSLKQQLQQVLSMSQKSLAQLPQPQQLPPLNNNNNNNQSEQAQTQKEEEAEPTSPAEVIPTTSTSTSVVESTSSSGMIAYNNQNENILDQVVRMLFPTKQQADDYIQQFPGDKFRFYVYDLPEPYDYRSIEQCIHNKPIFVNASNCVWGSEVCTETYSNDAKFSKRRFNRNGDVVMAKILTEYSGQMRTYNPTEANLFIVPYPSAGNCECREKYERCSKNIKPEELQEFFKTHSPYWNQPDLRHKHLFLVSNIFTDMHYYMRDVSNIPLVTTIGPAVGCDSNGRTKNNQLSRKFCGQIVMPYTNLNEIYQPNHLVEQATKLLLDGDDDGSRQITQEDIIKERPNALAAFVSTKIDGNPWTRVKLLEHATNLNHTMAGGLPIITGKMRHLRTMGKEQGIQHAYRTSIFCPVLRGDYPPQKRLFDVMLSGCIPVVLESPSDEEGYVSHFAKETFSIRLSYPFGTGIFPNDHNHKGTDDKDKTTTTTTTTRGIGLDYNDLVVPIPESCHAKGCMMEILEDMILNHPEQIRQKQKNIAKVVTLFSYGMGKDENGMKYPDAVAAMLVQARHYVHSLYNGSTKLERMESLQEFRTSNDGNDDDGSGKKKNNNNKKKKKTKFNKK